MKARGVFLLVASLFSVTGGRVICHHNSYFMHGSYCYRYVVSSGTYAEANKLCRRDGSRANLLYIDSSEEDNYIWSEMFAGRERKEFWLGLDDQLNEGDFRWSYNESRPIYTNYSSDLAQKNNNMYDCVKFTESGWQVAENYCENVDMPFVCKASACDSSDGVICDEVIMEESGGGVSVAAIAAIAIVMVILICILVVVIVLALLWKFKNDAFRHYLCPCVGRGSKQAMMSLQQENQRLRQELNQMKMGGSHRFSQGHFGRESVSGVPDGMGGMLPALKPGAGTGYLSPESFPRSPAQPPPLSLQRSTSRVTPMTPSATPFLSGSPPTVPPVFTAKATRPPVMKPAGGGGGVVVGAVSLPTLKENKREEELAAESSSEEEEDTPAGKTEQTQEKEPEPIASSEVKGHFEPDAKTTKGTEVTGDDVNTD
jgi:hypothetical protein